jgi:16S rRNA (guanine(966)-N(2))-methyltransferase RsmD
MRIIGGKYKGLAIRPPAWFKARPTTDRAREALFNILAHSTGIEDKKVLDLFSGSGAVSIEFLSRGAESVSSVEKDAKSADFIQGLLKQYGNPKCQVYESDALKFVLETPEKFDIIFADPPYHWARYHQLVEEIMKNELLNPGGWLIVEHMLGFHLHHETWVEHRVYSQSVFSFFRPLTGGLEAYS